MGQTIGFDLYLVRLMKCGDYMTESLHRKYSLLLTLSYQERRSQIRLIEFQHTLMGAVIL
jgi:hypothetical protein